MHVEVVGIESTVMFATNAATEALIIRLPGGHLVRVPIPEEAAEDLLREMTHANAQSQHEPPSPAPIIFPSVAEQQPRTASIPSHSPQPQQQPKVMCVGVDEKGYPIMQRVDGDDYVDPGEEIADDDDDGVGQI